MDEPKIKELTDEEASKIEQEMNKDEKNQEPVTSAKEQEVEEEKVL